MTTSQRNPSRQRRRSRISFSVVAVKRIALSARPVPLPSMKEAESSPPPWFARTNLSFGQGQAPWVNRSSCQRSGQVHLAPGGRGKMEPACSLDFQRELTSVLDVVTVQGSDPPSEQRG